MVFFRVREAKSTGTILSKREIKDLRAQTLNEAISLWKDDLKMKRRTLRPTLKVILTHWDQWVQGGPSNLTFRVTELLTGHRCFAEYLSKIGAFHSELCAECGQHKDNATHTFSECISFDRQREKMRIEIGGVVTYEKIILAISQGGRENLAVQEFCEDVMKKKEERNRENEKMDHARQNRKRRRRRAKKRRNLE